MTEQFEKLSNFIRNEMRMMHVYQPVMLIELLNRDGKASVTEIARALLGYDVSQVEYYEHITKNMVGRVLTVSRGITTKEKTNYTLNGFSDLTDEERQKLIEACKEKLYEFIDSRGDRAWLHRKKNSGYVSGTLRYEILKRAKFRCELCGISAEHKALEVDHILPRNHGGSDDLSNLQALCYSCNAMKRDRDDEDFRGIADEYTKREKGCVFCEISRERIVGENELAFAIRDAFPVTELHTLVIPKRHVSDFFDLYQPERNAIQQLLNDQRSEILNTDPKVKGFNVGNNVGSAAGQTVFHCHTHLIPRRADDVENPRGGVRGVVPNKQSY